MKSPSLRQNSKGFTLVEIMVVVVIIGLLASMGIPVFNRIRRQARQTTLISDGRMIGSAAQQYFASMGRTQVTINYDPSSGVISGDLTPWIKGLTRNYEFGDNVIDSGLSDSFSFSLPNAFGGAQVLFTDEGRTSVTADE